MRASTVLLQVLAVAAATGGLGGVAARFPEWNRVGVLSQGNFDTVHHLLPNAVPVIAGDQAELAALVESGQVDAGLISGVPDRARFEVISSGSISPRAMLTRPGDTRTRRLVDAAIVRLQGAGRLFDFADANAPFNFVEVHTCRAADPDTHLPLTPTSSTGNSSNSSVIRVGALGPFNWGQDGDYTASPPTGFWPDFLRGVSEVLAATNHTLERVWYPSSATVMAALAAGEVDVTEPYWTVDSFHNNRPRTWTFDAGCTTLGYESSFFTAKPAPAPPNMELAAVSGDGGEEAWVVPVAVVLSTLVVLALLTVAVLIHRERRGAPMFRRPLLNFDADAAEEDGRAAGGQDIQLSLHDTAFATQQSDA